MPCKEEEDEVNWEQSYAGINYALQGGGRRSQLRAESAKPMVNVIRQLVYSFTRRILHSLLLRQLWQQGTISSDARLFDIVCVFFFLYSRQLWQQWTITYDTTLSDIVRVVFFILNANQLFLLFFLIGGRQTWCVRIDIVNSLQMDICAYHIARRASAYKWFFYVFVCKNHSVWEKKKPPRALYTKRLFSV